MTVTIHSVIRNEERWAWFALKPWQEFATKMLVVDDKSLDQTPKILDALKINYTTNTNLSVTEIRNKLISQTTTDWFVLVDGDEVWNDSMIKKFLEYLESAPKKVTGVYLRTRNCVGDVWHYRSEESGKYRLGDKTGHLNIRAYRKRSGYRWFGKYPLEYYGQEHKPINDDPSQLAFFDGHYWHMTHLSRTCVTATPGFRNQVIEPGILVQKTELPETLFLPKPDRVPDPLIHRSWVYELMAKVLPRAIFFLLGFFFFAFSFISIIKHEFQFQTFGLDQGFYEQIIFKASNLDFSQSTIIEVLDKNLNLSFFQNDFHLTLLPLALIYKLFPFPWTILISQSLAAIATIFIVYLATWSKIKSKFVAFCVAFSMLFSVPFQHVVFDGFTPEVFGAFFLAVFFYALFSSNKRVIWLSVIGMAVSKVEFSPVISLLGITIFLFEKKKRLGLQLFIFGVLVFLFLVYFFNPLVSPEFRNYAHFSRGYGVIGDTPSDVLVNIFTNPKTVLWAAISPPVKLAYLFQQLFSHGFLVLAGFQVWILLGFEFFTRMANNVMVAKWPLHSFTITVVSGISLIYAANNLKNIIAPKILGIVLICFAVVGNIIFHGPINSLLKPQFYVQAQWSKDNHALLAKVPPNVPVAANNSLVPHLSSRDKIYLLPEISDAIYIVVDLRDAPNAFTPSDFITAKTQLDDLVATGQFKIADKIGSAILLERL